MTYAERVLVTGASGFTGGHLCERLSRNGNVVRFEDGDHANCRVVPKTRLTELIHPLTMSVTIAESWAIGEQKA